MELDDALATAKKSIQDADLPEAWAAPAFCVALLHLLGGVPGLTQVGALEGGGSQKNVKQDQQSGSENGVDGFAAKVNVDPSTLQDVYDFSEDKVSLVVGSSKIASSKAKATREMAILIAAGRQGMGLDDGWTAASHIREALSDYNRLDSSNFSTSLKANSDAFGYKGKGASVEVRLTKPGWEAAAELIQRLGRAAE